MAGAAAYAISLMLARAPAFAESFYGSGLGPALSRPLSLFTGLFPFSVADIVVSAYIAWLVALLVLAARSVIRRQRRAGNAIAGGTRRVVRDIGVLVALFYVLWGWHYARPSFATRAGWPEWSGISASEAEALAEQITTAMNRAYVALHGSPDAGRPTTFGDDSVAIDRALDEGWRRASAHVDLAPSAAARWGRVKQPIASAVLVRLGVSGIYVPFTAEANTLRGMPAVRAAFSMAHEQAHQRGITSEAEANFLGFVAASVAPSPVARYSAAVFAYGQIAGIIDGDNAELRQRLAAMVVPGIRRDLRDLGVFFDRVNRSARRVHIAVNDRYLRANRVPGGTKSYGLSVRLLITYARLHDGEVLPAVDPAAELSQLRSAP